MSSASTPPPRIATRYGTPKPRRHPRRARVLTLAALSGAVLAAGVFASTTGSPPVDSKDVGFSLGAEGRASVDFEVTKDRSASAQCTVQALSENYAVVGWDIVTIGPTDPGDGVNDGKTTSQRTDLRIDSPAVSGGVNACWIVED